MKTIKSNQVEKIIYPLDKLNFYLWQGLESKPYNVAVEKQGSKEEVTIRFTPKFYGEPLNAFDKRVYLAVCALYGAGNEYITAGQIFRTMGGKGSKEQARYEKLKASIEKMAVVRISINNEEEALKYKYPSFCIANDYLLNCSSVEKIEIRGGKSEYCLHIIEEPLLMKYAREHKQITTFNSEQFQLPLSLTEMNCAIDDYFRYRIARASGKTLKILHETLFKYCNIEDRRDKYRIKKRFFDFLDFYIRTGLMKSYSLETNAIIIQT